MAYCVATVAPRTVIVQVIWCITIYRACVRTLFSLPNNDVPVSCLLFFVHATIRKYRKGLYAFAPVHPTS